MHQNSKIRESGRPKYLGCKFEVESPWNLEILEGWLSDCQDKIIVEFLKYQWPTRAIDTAIDQNIPRNQKGARENKQAVRDYLIDELKNKSIIGPIVKNPFGNNTRISPLDTHQRVDMVFRGQ